VGSLWSSSGAAILQVHSQRCLWSHPIAGRHRPPVGVDTSSLIDSQQTYQRIGAVDEIFVDKVRLARWRESPDDD